MERGRVMKVAFAGAFAAQMAEPVRARLSLPCEVVVDDEAGIVPRLTDVDVLVSMGFSALMAGAAPRLRLVQVPGAGLDRIDRGALGPGTHLANAYGHEAGIAEYMIGAMIALTRSFRRLDAKMRNLIDERRLRLMKPAAFLVNVARAEIVDEGALYAALASGKLAGAALDVWYRYPTSTGPTPPATQPFHELGNVIMTPHISGWTEGMLEARAKLIADNIARTARGETTLNVIKPAS